jgi:hypothetical protein
MIAMIMHAAASARSRPDQRRLPGPAAPRRDGRVALLGLVVLLLAGSAAPAAEAVAAASAKPAASAARFDERFPKPQDNFADRFPQPQSAPTEPPPKRVVTTIERFPRRGGELRTSDTRRQPPPVVAPAASVRAY